MARWRVGVDTGGTFTDLVAISESGELRTCKVPSNPADPSTPVFSALSQSGVPSEDGVGNLVLGTTIATNAALARKGASSSPAYDGRV